MYRYLLLFLLKLRGFYYRVSNRDISKTAHLARGVQILGVRNVKIGENCTVGENTVFTINIRDDSKRLLIGNNVYIGRDNFFAVGSSIIVNDYSMLGNKCSLMCSDHGFDNPMIPYSLSEINNDKHIVIGVNCWIGYNVSIVGNITIGHGSIIGANAVVLQDVPPFSVAVGNPARVVKRYNFKSNLWEKGVDIQMNKFLDEGVYLENLKKSGSFATAYHSSSSMWGDL